MCIRDRSLYQSLAKGCPAGKRPSGGQQLGRVTSGGAEPVEGDAQDGGEEEEVFKVKADDTSVAGTAAVDADRARRISEA